MFISIPIFVKLAEIRISKDFDKILSQFRDNLY